MMQRLLDIGFRKIGEWNLSAGRVECAVGEERESKKLYAFVTALHREDCTTSQG